MTSATTRNPLPIDDLRQTFADDAILISQVMSVVTGAANWKNGDHTPTLFITVKSDTTQQQTDTLRAYKHPDGLPVKIKTPLSSTTSHLAFQ